MNRKPIAIIAITFFLVLVTGSAAESQQPAVAPQKTQDVVFGPMRKYTHKTGWFSVDAPGNWNIADKSADGEVIVSIIDPTENGVLVVRVYQPTRGYTQAELGAMLKSFLNERMGSFDGFTMGELRSQKDGSIGVYFKYNSLVSGGSYKMYGDAFIEQHNGLIGLLTLIMPTDQYEAKQKAAYDFVNSFRVIGTAP